METIANVFKALSEPTRLRILALLQVGELCVCDLMAVLEMPQSTVSRHLSTLKHAGLVTGRRGGKWMYYKLAEQPDELRDLAGEITVRRVSATVQASADAEALRRHLQTKSQQERCA